MAQTIQIPGRRVSNGETFRTSWSPRGGDCVILRVEVLIAAGIDGDKVNFSLETRGEDGTSVEDIDPTHPVAGLSLDGTGVATCLYLATTSTTPGNGAQEEVRVVVTCTGSVGDGGYFVVRVFPLIFFDSAKPY